VAIEDLDGEGLLLDPRSGSVHRLNETALFVWRRCDGRRTTRQIAHEATEHYDTESSFALECVEQLLVRLAALGLLEKPVPTD
jgi:PqqD family protein of HPr-rel-A system